MIVIKTDRNKSYYPDVIYITEIKNFNWDDYKWANPKEQSFWFDGIIHKIEEDETHIHMLINMENLHLLPEIKWTDDRNLIQKAVEWNRDNKIENILK